MKCLQVSHLFIAQIVKNFLIKLNMAMLNIQITYLQQLDHFLKVYLSRILKKDLDMVIFINKDEVKNHLFFSNMNWDALLQKKIIPPFKPILESNEDASHFDNEFT